MATPVILSKVESTMKLGERRLKPQVAVRLTGIRAGGAILCTGGRLWVTQEGDPEDYVLQRGGAFVARRRGVVVVQALTQAAYRLFSSL